MDSSDQVTVIFIQKRYTAPNKPLFRFNAFLIEKYISIHPLCSWIITTFEWTSNLLAAVPWFTNYAVKNVIRICNYGYKG